jgi:hypothetical protein
LPSAGRTNLIDVKDWIISAFPTRYLDFWTTVARSDGSINPSYSAGDGIHLNNAGHQILYSRVVASRLYERTFAPVFESVAKAGGGIEFIWSVPPGMTAQLQYVSDVTSSDWTNVSNAMIVTNGIISRADVLTPAPARFYRLMLVP